MQTTTLKQTFQAIVDETRERAGGGLAMVIDRQTGLVLCKSVARLISQNNLDRLAERAQTLLGEAAKAPLRGAQSDICCATHIDASGTLSVAASLRADEALVFHGGAPADIGALTQAAAKIAEASLSVGAA